MRFGDRIGRRRSYGAFYLLLAVAGLVIALHPSLIVIAIVALTGWGQEEDRRRSADAGFDHHMVKPVDPTALEKLLASIKTV